MQHELKCWPVYFSPTLLELKTFEIRKNDRNFQVDDTLRLREWCPIKEEYTGRELLRRVTYRLDLPGVAQVEQGFTAMAIVPIY